eukprot:TRINITY_DN12879_c0_g1_i1.p1 TRINITY_DN12879_c0_g1~~TRINITY_DN12879_c0_g1_i1.p1  ORF type:complete len:91 (-),score=6.72 TRINITY_DN12879_c0_g1_i1:251-523(-)
MSIKRSECFFVCTARGVFRGLFVFFGFQSCSILSYETNFHFNDVCVHHFLGARGSKVPCCLKVLSHGGVMPPVVNFYCVLARLRMLTLCA